MPTLFQTYPKRNIRKYLKTAPSCKLQAKFNNRSFKSPLLPWQPYCFSLSLHCMHEILSHFISALYSSLCKRAIMPAVKRLIWTEPRSHINTLLDTENHHFCRCIHATLFAKCFGNILHTADIISSILP